MIKTISNFCHQDFQLLRSFQGVSGEHFFQEIHRGVSTRKFDHKHVFSIGEIKKLKSVLNVMKDLHGLY